MSSLRSYLAVVTTAGGGNWEKDDADDGSAAVVDRHILTVFDVANKFVALAAPVRPVRALVSEWGLLFAITMDNRLVQLTEKDIQSKLDMLFKRNFYDVAVKIAKSQQYDADGIVDIFRQYGDHLYSKGDYAGAIGNVD